MPETRKLSLNRRVFAVFAGGPVVSSNFVIEQQDGITTIRLTRRLGVGDFLNMLEDIVKHEIGDRRLWDATENFNFSAEDIVYFQRD